MDGCLGGPVLGGVSVVLYMAASERVDGKQILLAVIKLRMT